jgi:myosin-5
VRDIRPGGPLLNLPRGELPKGPEANDRYYMLVPSKQWRGNDDVRSLCTLILEKAIPEDDRYQMGLTKIFFRAGMLALLESQRTNRINQLVTLVQKNVRRMIDYKRYQRMRKSSITIQAWWRGVLARKAYEDLRRETAAIRIQKQVRGWLARREYVRTREAVIRIQSGMSFLYPGV